MGHTLPDGMRLELLHAPSTAPPPAAGAPPAPCILFVHGSYHGAWCWAERFMPYFATAPGGGYDCWAVSLRGQGGSERGALKVAGDLQSHADDLGSVVAALPAPPVLVGHSFGALLVLHYAAQLGGGDAAAGNDDARAGAARPPIAGVASLCGVPPSGNAPIVARVLRRSLRDAWEITW